MRASAPAEWQEADRGYQAWLQHRISEYVEAHGMASSGVCALLERAGAAYADSQYLRALGASKGDPELLLKAHQLATFARQQELTAFEICAREGRVYRETLNARDRSSLVEAQAADLARAPAQPAKRKRRARSGDPPTWPDSASPFAPPPGVESQGPPTPPTSHPSSPTEPAPPPSPDSTLPPPPRSPSEPSPFRPPDTTPRGHEPGAPTEDE